MFRNYLNEFWDIYHGTNMGAGSPKAASLYMVAKSRLESNQGIDHLALRHL
jgi:hypothetical protein